MEWQHLDMHIVCYLSSPPPSKEGQIAQLIGRSCSSVFLETVCGTLDLAYVGVELFQVSVKLRSSILSIADRSPRFAPNIRLARLVTRSTLYHLRVLVAPVMPRESPRLWSMASPDNPATVFTQWPRPIQRVLTISSCIRFKPRVSIPGSNVRSRKQRHNI